MVALDLRSGSQTTPHKLHWPLQRAREHLQHDERQQRKELKMSYLAYHEHHAAFMDYRVVTQRPTRRAPRKTRHVIASSALLATTMHHDLFCCLNLAKHWARVSLPRSSLKSATRKSSTEHWYQRPNTSFSLFLKACCRSLVFEVLWAQNPKAHGTPWSASNTWHQIDHIPAAVQVKALRSLGLLLRQ